MFGEEPNLGATCPRAAAQPFRLEVCDIAASLLRLVASVGPEVRATVLSCRFSGTWEALGEGETVPGGSAAAAEALGLTGAAARVVLACVRRRSFDALRTFVAGESPEALQAFTRLVGDAVLRCVSVTVDTTGKVCFLIKQDPERLFIPENTAKQLFDGIAAWFAPERLEAAPGRVRVVVFHGPVGTNRFAAARCLAGAMGALWCLAVMTDLASVAEGVLALETNAVPGRPCVLILIREAEAEQPSEGFFDYLDHFANGRFPYGLLVVCIFNTPDCASRVHRTVEFRAVRDEELARAFAHHRPDLAPLWTDRFVAEVRAARGGNEVPIRVVLDHLARFPPAENEESSDGVPPVVARAGEVSAEYARRLGLRGTSWCTGANDGMYL